MTASSPERGVSRASEHPEGPRFYRRRWRPSMLLPNRWAAVHGWFFVIFLVATFGPMFHLWAGSTEIVWGWPISIGWILGWMVLQTANIVAFYFTTVRPSVRSLAATADADLEPSS